MVSGAVAGAGQKADAYRGELLGIYTILFVLKRADKLCSSVVGGSLKHGCDNKMASWISEASSTRDQC